MADDFDMRKANKDQLMGLEILEVTPVILGGNPSDPDNKTFLTRHEHIQAVRYWNKVVREKRESKE